MEKNELFLHGEVDDEQSPQSNQTWPMGKIRQSLFQQKMSSLLSPVTPKRNYSVSNAKSLLLQCLRDSKSDPIPRKRFLVSCSDEGILMDGVLVTSATGKKVSDSPSRLSSLGRSARSSLVRSHIKNTEFSSPRSQAGRNQDTTRSQTSSGGQVKMLENVPTCTKVATPKVSNPSNLKATAEPFILTPRSSHTLASPIPVQKLPFDHNPHFQWGNPPPNQQLPPSYGHLYPPPRPTGYQMAHDFNQSPARNNPRISLLPTTPLSSHLNTNTSKPPVHTPITTSQTANLSTSSTTCGPRLDSSPSIDGIVKVTQKPYLSSPSDELVTMMETRDLSSPSAELKTSTHKPDISAYAGLETMTTEKDWSPSDDGLPRFTLAQTDFMKSQDRVLPDDASEHYKYSKRLPIFTQLCLDDKEGCDNTTYQAYTALQTRPLTPP